MIKLYRYLFILIITYLFIFHPSNVFAQTITPYLSITPTPTPTTIPITNALLPIASLSATPFPSLNLAPSPSANSQITNTSLFINKGFIKSFKGTMDLYFQKTDFQAKENPSFLITSSTSPTPITSMNPFIKAFQTLIMPVFAQNVSLATVSAQITDSNNNPIPIPAAIQRLNSNTLQITLNKGNSFQPGDFHLVVTDGNDSVIQDFSWGVLALNLDKSIYLPNQTADIQMAALDNNGSVLCNAILTLTITDPANRVTTLSTVDKTITVNSVCETHTITVQPDYETHYAVNTPGLYSMSLVAVTANGSHSITDSFSVANSVAFDITRKSATRIYPPNTYPMNFNILFNQDYTGTIEETIPNNFIILPATYSLSFTNTQTVNNNTILIWKITAKKGTTLSLGYNFQTPNISPQFYLLGPLQLFDNNHNLLFAEQRQWEIAADVIFPATTYLSKTASTKITSAVSNQVVTSAPSSTNTTTSVEQKKVIAYFQWEPSIGLNTTNQSSVPTSPDGKGFIYDTALDSTIPTGTWVFNVNTQASSGTGIGYVVVCAWKVTVASGAITTNSTIFPSSAKCAQGSTNIMTSTSSILSSVSIPSVAAVSFDNSQYLYVEYWLRMISSGTSATGKTTFKINGGSAEDIVLPSASSNLAPSAPSQDSPINAATSVSTTPTFLMTTTDPESDNLQYKVTIYSNSGCSTVIQTDAQATSQTGWTGQNATISTTNDSYSSGTQGSYLTQTALANSTTYYWKASAIDPSGSNTYTNSSTCNSFTTASSSQPPNSPTSLSQIRVTAATTIASGGWTNETQVKFTVSATSPNASDTLAVCVEAQDLGTSFTNSGTCGTGVAYSGTAVTPTVTLTGLTDATSYHWQAKVTGTGGSSAWVAFGNGSTLDFGVDTTAPTGGNVYDGATTGVETSINNGSLSALTANWANFNSNVSGLNYYNYAVGTTAGGTNVINWTNNSTATSISLTGLTLQTSKIYYVSVEAVDNAGNIGTPVTSSGQSVAPTLTFSFSPLSITFNNLNAGNSFTDTQNTVITTSTNAYNGYIVNLFTTQDLTSTLFPSDTIGGFTGGTYTTPAVYSSGDTGLGITSSAATVQGVNKFQPSGGIGTLYFPPSHTGPGNIIADHTANVSGSPISNEQFTITYKVITNSSQVAGPYSTTAVYTITPQY